MIVVKDLKKNYKKIIKKSFFRKNVTEVEALKGINLSIEPGKIVGLLGINGAGKTTTIKILSTLLTKTSGEIYIDEERIDKDEKKVREKINMIAGGERMLYWRLTARENLKYFGRLYNLNESKLNETIDKLLDFFDLQDRADEPIENYSKGMKQRIQIARGLINDPKYIFLDEPTLGLDVLIAKEVRNLIKKLAQEQNKGILLTSHYLNEIEELCDYVYIIDNGRNILEGSPKEIIKRITSNKKEYILEIKDSENYVTKLEKEIYQDIKIEEKDNETLLLSVKLNSTEKKKLFSDIEDKAEIISYSTKNTDLEEAIIMLSEDIKNDVYI